MSVTMDDFTRESIANIEAHHRALCGGYDSGCACFERLLACVRGEPDPDGEAYRWPVLTYDQPQPYREPGPNWFAKMYADPRVPPGEMWLVSTASFAQGEKPPPPVRVYGIGDLPEPPPQPDPKE